MAAPPPAQAAQAGFNFEQRHEFTVHNLNLPVKAPRPGHFKDFYDMKEELGKGGFGTVRRCVTKGAQGGRREMAAKINNTPDKAAEQILECGICAELSCTLQPTANPPAEFTSYAPSRFIINLYDAVAEGDIVYNIYEIASGGDLSDEIARREFFNVDDAREAFHQIIEGVNHMHQRGYLHCDLKPQNILIEHKRRLVYKVADFGLSKRRTPDPANPNAHICEQRYVPDVHGERGTHMYNCPQKFTTRAYDVTSDWWSCACILYQMLAGYPPFYGDRNELLLLVAPGQTPNFGPPVVEYNSPEWDDPNLVEARALLDRLFVDNPITRPGFGAMKLDAFLQGHPRPPLPPYTTTDLTLQSYYEKKFQKRNILRAALGLNPLPAQQGGGAGGGAQAGGGAAVPP